MPTTQRRSPWAWDYSDIVEDLHKLKNSKLGVDGTSRKALPALASHPAVTDAMRAQNDASFRDALRTILAQALRGIPSTDLQKGVAAYLGLAAGSAYLTQKERVQQAVKKSKATSRDDLQKERGTDEDWTRSKLTLAFEDMEAMLDSIAIQRSGSDATPLDPLYDLPQGLIAEDVFVPSPGGEARHQEELDAVDERRAETWWERAEGLWLGQFYTFWSKDIDTPCDLIRFEYTDEDYHAEGFSVASEENGDKTRTTIIEGDGFNSDDDLNWTIRCARTNWNFAYHWARENGRTLLANEVSAFGATDRKAYPGIAGVHVVLRTTDGYILFALRSSKRVSFYPSTWSVSFEESVAPEQRRGGFGPAEGDITVLNTIEGGLHEEFRLPASCIQKSSCLALGRHYAQSPKAGFDLSSTIIAGVQISLNLEEVWHCLTRRARRSAPDFNEHRAWAGVKFHDRAHAMRFLRFARDRTEGTDIFDDFAAVDPAGLDARPYRGARTSNVADRGLHLTSAARLYLGTLWFDD